MSKPAPALSGRLLSLDYLRGYFVIVIIVDHLWKYPSLWALISGEAKLWVTAAEGFVMISGFLIGYIRGYKGLKLPFIDIAWKLVKRAFLLYFWMVIVSLGYIWLEWSDMIPNMPHTALQDETNRSWSEVFWNIASTEHPHMWIHFLYLYTAFLLLSVIMVALLRRRQPWLVLVVTLLLYLAGINYNIAWMKWQVIFFLPTLAGFYFDTIRNRWSDTDAGVRRRIKASLGILTVATVVLSALAANAPTLFSSELLSIIAGLFTIEDFLPPRVLMAILWFISFAFLFEWLTPYLKKYTYGVVEYMGTHSLTVYVVHGYIICLVNFLLPTIVPDITKIPYYTVLGFLAIMGVYVAIRLPILRRVLPK